MLGRVFVVFGISGWWDFLEWLWNIPSSSNILEQFEEWYKFFFICSDKISQWTHLVLRFVCREFFFFLIANSISLLVISIFKLSVSSWLSFDKLYGSRSLIIYFRLSNLLACVVYNIFTVFIPVIFFIFVFSILLIGDFLVLSLHLPGPYSFLHII